MQMFKQIMLHFQNPLTREKILIVPPPCDSLIYAWVTTSQPPIFIILAFETMTIQYPKKATLLASRRAEMKLGHFRLTVIMKMCMD